MQYDYVQVTPMQLQNLVRAGMRNFWLSLYGLHDKS